MASAWEQAAELQSANQRLHQFQVSMAVGESLHARHLSRLPDETMLRVAAPAFGRLRQPAGASLLAYDLRSCRCGNPVGDAPSDGSADR